MILPLDNRVLVQETDDESLWVYEDTKGGRRRRPPRNSSSPANKRSNSVEHQDSALTWNFDNWMYTAQGGERYRIKNGKWEKERVLGEFNQWGLGVDDWGNMYFSQNEIPGRDFQQPWERAEPHRRAEPIGPASPGPSSDPDTDGAFQRVYRIFSRSATAAKRPKPIIPAPAASPFIAAMRCRRTPMAICSSASLAAIWCAAGRSKSMRKGKRTIS